MTTDGYYVTTAIPYVNGDPHLGHALELVQADVLARHQRRRGRHVRFQTGTDDNAGKNVTAARAAGVPVREFVDTNAARFAALRDPLQLSFDDFIRTSADPRHAAGVARLWRRNAARGDLYQRRYEGLYCTGCEQFVTAEDLTDGQCPEHATPPQRVSELNWFFRLSRYAAPLREAIESGRLRIEPAAKRNEVLAFIHAGLTDFSVSRPAVRTDGWGISVPDDPSQVVYVWWDALANYVTALGYGSGAEAYRRWWTDSRERVHVIGKGVLRFHAVYWPALLLSAGEPLPTTIVVHDYLTVRGAKIAKSRGNTADPVQLSARYGSDALRWWLLREVPRVGDVDFTEARLAERYDRDLANGFGNLVNRTVSLVHKYRGGIVPGATDRKPRVAGSTGEATARIESLVRDLPDEIDRNLGRFDFRAATETLWSVVDTGNQVVESERPWDIARREQAGDPAARAHLDGVLATLVHACRRTAAELGPFLPVGSQRLSHQLGTGQVVGEPGAAFPRSVTVT